MSVIVLGSAKAAPGVTTTTVALAATWPTDRDVLVVEGDADGGVLGARHQVATEPGLSTLAVSTRRSLEPSALADHVQPLSEGVSVLVGPPTAEQSRRALGLAAHPLAAALSQLDATDVLVDVGRLRPDSPSAPLVDVADVVVLMARPRIDELQHLPARIRALRPGTRRMGVLLVGSRPYPPAEVAVALDTEVVAVVADDARAAAALSGRTSTSALGRTALMRSVHTAGEALRAWLSAATPAENVTAVGTDPDDDPVDLIPRPGVRP